MVKIKEAILVEGRYDKNTLSQIVDAPILETAGFGIFKDKKQLALLRRVAEKRGLIVFTDSDGAGFVIRNHPNEVLRVFAANPFELADVDTPEMLTMLLQ